MSSGKFAEPALRSYFFGKGYRDLVATISNSWSKNLASAQHEFQAGGKAWPEHLFAKGWAILRFSAGISIIVFGTVFFLAFSVLHVTLLAVFFLLVYSAFTLLYLAESTYVAIKGFFTVCPECHAKMPLPHYLCPRCGEAHQRLIPSSYGILRRTCRCGERLPTTFWGGRGKIPARCPNPDCHHLLSDAVAESKKHFVPIFGGPQVGKSALLSAAISELIDQAQHRGFASFFLHDKAAKDFERVQEQLARGRVPDKTRDPLPRAFNLELRKPGEDRRLLYLYDPAGELFTSDEHLVAQSYQAYLSGVIFLVDPFSLPELKRRYRAELVDLGQTLSPSRLASEDAVGRFLLGLEQYFGLTKTGQIKKPVAVVINKIDAFGLESLVGEAAIENAIRTAGAAGRKEAVQNEVLRQHLIQWGAGDLVHQLEARCPLLRYFACSSLGRMPDDSQRPFDGRGVLPPLTWILGKGDPVLRWDSDRSP